MEPAASSAQVDGSAGRRPTVQSGETPGPPATRTLPSKRTILCLYAVVAAVASLYVVGVLIPYYAHDLDQLPYSELTSGRHDPKWLSGTSDVALCAGYLSLLLVPLTALVVIGLVLHLAVREDDARERLRKAPGRATALGVLVAVCGALCAYQFTPMAGALATWLLD